MVHLRQGLSIVEVDDGKVVLDTRRGVYWHLNRTAITVVEELGRGRAFDDLIREIVRETGADEDRVRSDHLALLDELRRAKLIEGKLP
ncbi:Coenzyme PQQ synthesis protein D (PqqD) [Sinosporangium album]|uniref:Coenzyme PQQ synthesis protein D (PqqD) n=1 Tax=Sinosporangium album TaxID=504805 RepID=A0A1G8K367_9ACTN|nr:lasso peptide biosynthesis PqqD family chaperone [Sinosporangium album]SDI37868.1 Coenzyme PQQ synthesis protein D (PqqD) [Sinosporangium album]